MSFIEIIPESNFKGIYNFVKQFKRLFEFWVGRSDGM